MQEPPPPSRGDDEAAGAGEDEQQAHDMDVPEHLLVMEAAKRRALALWDAALERPDAQVDEVEAGACAHLGADEDEDDFLSDWDVLVAAQELPLQVRLPRGQKTGFRWQRDARARGGMRIARARAHAAAFFFCARAASPTSGVW